MPAHCEEALSRVLHSCRRSEHGLLPLEDPGSPVWQIVRCCCPCEPAAPVQMDMHVVKYGSCPGRAAPARDITVLLVIRFALAGKSQYLVSMWLS